MAIVRQNGTVDLIPEYNRQLRPVFCVSEGDDDSRVINLSITSGGEVFPIPSGAMVYIAGKKQDNNIFTYRCSYTSNTVVFPITAQMSADDGIVLCELQVIVDGDPLGSANFVYWVEPSPIQNGTTSESDLNLFEQALAQFEKFDHFYADVEAMVTEAVANMQIREGQTVIDASLTVGGAAADAKATGDIVRAFMDALVSETTPTAAIATCDDAAGGLPLKRLVANIEPTQAGSGDPSPDNVRAISGYTGVTVTRTGKNILPNIVQDVTKGGITMTRDADGTLIFNGTATQNLTFYLNNETSGTPDTVSLKPGTYTLSGCPAGGSGSTYRIQLYRYHDGEFINQSYYENGEPITITAEEGDGYRPFVRIANGYVCNNLTFKPQLEIGETATEYEPYNGATYPVTFPTDAGTVYGGTLTVNGDGSGTLTVDRAEIASYAGETLPGEWISDRDVYSAGTTPTTGAQVVYKLATPTTYALSAVEVVQMLSGNNAIWTDAAGTVSGEYYASTALYVQKIVNAQKGMIAGVEAEMTASKNYAIGDLMIVGDALYKATAAISSGAALVVGTNIAQTTVAEQLIALANA